jgi:hypothetical protein
LKGKIIGVGFQKTGTSTLRDALKILNYSVKDTSTRALIPILKNDYKKVLKIIDKFDAIEDTPWYIIYKELDKLLPGSKFILTIRDEQSWYKSVSRHIGNLRSAHHEWIYGKGKGLPKDYKENTINVYNNHNKKVVEYFKNRPNDLLIIDFTKGDRWDKLCKFLDKDIPKEVFPHANNSKINKLKKNVILAKFKLNRKKFRQYLKINYISLRGWW